MIIYPYKAGSKSSKALSDALGVRRISHRNSKFVGSPDKVVINWGASTVPEQVALCNIINKPDAVELAANKLAFFNSVAASGVCKIKGPDGIEHVVEAASEYVRGLRVGMPARNLFGFTIVEMQKPALCNIPEYTVDINKAVNWAVEGNTVLCRTKLNGSSGEGVVVAQSPLNVVGAPMYVKYIPKKSEWRVHVFRGEVVDVQRKARRREVPDDKINWLIRNHDNGFVFARGEERGEIANGVEEQALAAVAASGLDFGAVDVIYNEARDMAYVLEINTAPGIEGSTLDGYVERFNTLREA